MEWSRLKLSFHLKRRGGNAMPTDFVACKEAVLNRGSAPESFLLEIVAWAKEAPDEIFLPNQRTDIYSSVVAELGPWNGLLHRKAVMLESFVF